MKLRYEFFILLVFLLIIYSCSKKNNDIFGTIDGEDIYVTTLDSIAGYSLYKLREETFQLLAKNRILENESKKANISIDSFISKEVYIKININKNDLVNFINNSINSNFCSYCVVDSLKALKQFIRIKEISTLKKYIDSLNQLYSVKVFYEPINIDKKTCSKIYGHKRGNERSKKSIIILYNFDCFACKESDLIIDEIYNKYKRKINFINIYFNNYIDKAAIACEAADLQGKYWEMHNILFRNSGKLDNAIYSKLADSLGLDVERFNQDLNNNIHLKELSETRDLFYRYGIYQTPFFIVNGKLIVEDVKYLEKVILNEI